jgi:hypothetical protein
MVVDYNPSISNGWNYIVIPKSEFAVSGSTAGWHYIDGVRYRFYESTTTANVADTVVSVDGLRAYHSAACTGSSGTTAAETITAYSVPFNQYSTTLNKIRFIVRNMRWQAGFSDVYTVRTSSSAQLYAAPKLTAAGGAHNTPDATFKLGEVYSFPNPAKDGYNPTIHVEVGIADKVEFWIYDISGELVHKAELDGSKWVIVDNKYCYEYAWDARSSASGVYIYLVKAHKSGYEPIKVVKKLAIIK